MQYPHEVNKTDVVRQILFSDKLTCREIYQLTRLDYPFITQRNISASLSLLLSRKEIRSRSSRAHGGLTVYWTNASKPEIVAPRLAHWLMRTPISNLNHWPHGE